MATGTIGGEQAFVDVGTTSQQIDPTNSAQVQAFDSAVSSQLGSSGTSETSTVQLPAGPALRDAITIPQGAETVNQTVFFVDARGGQTFGLIVAIVGSDANTNVVDQIAQTLSIK